MHGNIDIDMVQLYVIYKDINSLQSTGCWWVYPDLIKMGYLVPLICGLSTTQVCDMPPDPPG